MRLDAGCFRLPDFQGFVAATSPPCYYGFLGEAVELFGLVLIDCISHVSHTASPWQYCASSPGQGSRVPS